MIFWWIRKPTWRGKWRCCLQKQDFSMWQWTELFLNLTSDSLLSRGSAMNLPSCGSSGQTQKATSRRLIRNWWENTQRMWQMHWRVKCATWKKLFTRILAHCNYSRKYSDCSSKVSMETCAYSCASSLHYRRLWLEVSVHSASWNSLKTICAPQRARKGSMDSPSPPLRENCPKDCKDWTSKDIIGDFTARKIRRLALGPKH